MHAQYFLWPPDWGKKGDRPFSRMNLFFKLPMWWITVESAQLAFQLPRGLFSLACHVAWMIYLQYTPLISNKFVIWINWKHKIMTIAFAFLGVLLLYLCLSILYLNIKKGKYQKEEDYCERTLSREMEKWRKKVKVLLTGRQKEKEIY